MEQEKKPATLQRVRKKHGSRKLCGGEKPAGANSEQPGFLHQWLPLQALVKSTQRLDTHVNGFPILEKNILSLYLYWVLVFNFVI